MQISKERFRQLIREEVETHLQEQERKLSDEEMMQRHRDEREAKIRIEWSRQFLDTLDVSEKNYRRLLDAINSIRAPTESVPAEEDLFPSPTEDPREKIQEGSLLMEKPPDHIVPSGKPEEEGAPRKWAPHLWHQNPNIKAAIKYIKKVPPWARVPTSSCHLTKAKGNCIPGPSPEVCELMKLYLADSPLRLPKLTINGSIYFHKICLDPQRAAAGERPNRICGDFKKETEAYREGRNTTTRATWSTLINWCNWPIPTSGIVITDPVQRAIPLVFLGMAIPEVEKPEEPEEYAKWRDDAFDIYFKSERTQALRDIEREIKAADSPDSLEEVVDMAAWALFVYGGPFWKALLTYASLSLLAQIHDRFMRDEIELTPEQEGELQMALMKRGHNIDLSKEADIEEPLKKFGCTAPPHTRPLTSFDLEQYEKMLLEKPWGKKEGDEFQSYVQRSTGRVGGSDDLVKQYRIWKLLGSAAASNYIPGKWPTTRAVQKLLKDFRRDDDWNKFEQCMRKSPLFKQEYGDVPVGFLTAPPSPEKKEIESCIERFGDAGKQRAIRDKGQEYRRRTGKSLPVPIPAAHGAAPRIMNQRCLQMLCSKGNKLACRTLKK